jgi:sterol desaturase/sphingolipid hydroxylase (fatty acid hydroxylase superfamily)
MVMLNPGTPQATAPQTPPGARSGVGLRVAILILGAGVCAYIASEVNTISHFEVFVPRERWVSTNAVFVILLWVVSLAAVWGAPLLAAGLFAATTAAAWYLASTKDYGNMYVWGAGAAILAVLCVVDWSRRGRFAGHPILRRVHVGGALVALRVLAVIGGIVVAAVIAKLIGL